MMAPADERKERVLHTRVPQSLERRLKDRARRLGMSVSTVVRHVLLNTFGLVEDIVTDSTNVALALAGVLAWQEAVLNRNAVCEHCNAVLRKGGRAALGIGEAGALRTDICLRCLERVGQEPARLAPRPSRR